MTPVIEGFDHRRVPVAEGVSLHVAVGGSGPPLVLLHGFPQTHLMSAARRARTRRRPRP